MIIAQLGDLLSPETWVLLMCGGGAGPLLCWLAAGAWKGRRYLDRMWRWVAVYYTAVLLGLVLLVSSCHRRIFFPTPPWLEYLVLLLTIVVGPLAGFVFLCVAAVLPRYSPGLCQQCGYDLTGNVTGRCPECGHASGIR